MQLLQQSQRLFRHGIINKRHGGTAVRKKSLQFSLKKISFMWGEETPLVVTLRANGILFTFERPEGKVLLASFSPAENLLSKRSAKMRDDKGQLRKLTAEAQKLFRLGPDQARKLHGEKVKVITSRQGIIPNPIMKEGGTCPLRSLA